MFKLKEQILVQMMCLKYLDKTTDRCNIISISFQTFIKEKFSIFCSEIYLLLVLFFLSFVLFPVNLIEVECITKVI